jgi:hypothetical protein
MRIGSGYVYTIRIYMYDTTVPTHQFEVVWLAVHLLHDLHVLLKHIRGRDLLLHLDSERDRKGKQMGK